MKIEVWSSRQEIKLLLNLLLVCLFYATSVAACIRSQPDAVSRTKTNKLSKRDIKNVKFEKGSS